MWKLPDRKTHPLSQHMRNTYFSLRRGMVALSVTLPLMLWMGGALVGVPLQDSMSHYHFVTPASQPDAFPLRTWLVGLLFAIGSFLWLYKGFSEQEDLFLNLAGLCAWMVALFPMDATGQPTAADSGVLSALSIHGSAAVLLFACLAWVAWRCAGDTLDLLPADQRHLKPLFRHLYRACAILMVALPWAAFVLGAVGLLGPYKFVAEACAIWVFAAYWWIKHRELLLSGADAKALTGGLDGWRVPTHEKETARPDSSTPARADWAALWAVLFTRGRAG